MNPYSLIAKIKQSLADFSDVPLLRESENKQAEKAARFLSFIQSQSEANPDGATAEFARNLDSLLRPGSDSRIDLASAYAGLEGMFNEILNQLPCILGKEEVRKALKYDELCASKKYQEEVLAPYRASVGNFNLNSMLGLIILCMAVLNECNKVKKDPRFDNGLSGLDPKRDGDEWRKKALSTASIGIYQFYFYKLYDGNKNVPRENVNDVVIKFLTSQAGNLVCSIFGNYKLVNLKDFGQKINLFASTKYETQGASSLLGVINSVCEYRNKLNHGALHSDEVKEHTSSSRDERKKLARRRKAQHKEAVAAMLVLLIMLINDKSDIKVSRTTLLGYKLAYFASYAPVWTLNRVALLGTGTVLYVIPKLLSLGIPVALLFVFLSKVGKDMTPIYLEPEMKLAAFDAMLDGDAKRLVAIRDKVHFDLFNKSTRSVRERRAAAETAWRLRDKPDKEFKNGRNLYPNPSVDFYPMQSQLDNYMKTQLRILADELVKYADGNPVRLGVASAATSVELEHTPGLHDMRYSAVEAYMRSILPPNISVERLERDEHHVSVDFYIIPNDV